MLQLKEQLCYYVPPIQQTHYRPTFINGTNCDRNSESLH